MANEKRELTAWGVYRLGYYLERLEWAIATILDPIQLASFFEVLRGYEQVHSFEEIGREAKYYHNMLSSYDNKEVSIDTQDNLRNCRTRWSTLASERLQDMCLVRPRSTIDPKHLMHGIVGFLSQENLSFLEQIEVSDLNEACRCILIGSATAAEHIALRAAENLLRRWYERVTGQELRRDTWGTVLDRLAKEYPEVGRPKEITLLGYLKQRRDEVAHPQRVSSLREAETTLMNVCCLINGIKSVLAMLPYSPIPNTQLAMSRPKAHNLEKRATKGREGTSTREHTEEK